MDDVPPQVPDPDLLARVMAAIDDGAEFDIAGLSKSLAASEAEIAAALAAAQTYRELVQNERASAASGATSSEEAFAPGTRVADFVIEQRLGAGAMGIVYRARQVSLGNRLVALKVLPPSLAARDPRFVERFRREASLAATIHHPNLAEVYGIETSDDGLLCFAMRLVEGRTLQEVLIDLAHRQEGAVRRTSRGHVRRCAEVARDIAAALAEVHAHALVHRDVKPSNVILEGAGFDPEDALRARPVLIDFGLLRSTGDTELTGTRTLLGTPAYASHETQLGRDVDARADVFSLGAVLHDLLASTSPGTRGPATSGLGDVRAVNPTVDVRLAAIVDMALQEQQHLRYANGGAMRDELDRYLRGEAVRARPTGMLGRLALWSRRQPIRAAWGVAAAFVVLTLVALGSSFVRTAWSLTNLASAAANQEREGNLIEAARSYRTLFGERTEAHLMPWLSDDIAHAASYAMPGGAIFEAAGHLLAGAAALPSMSDETMPFAAEREFATAADRLCEILVSKDRAPWHDCVRRFLLQEARSGTPETRRRIALDTWANYHVAQGKGQETDPALLDLLRFMTGPEGHQLRPDTRQAATSALASIRTKSALQALIPLIGDADLECVRLARAGARHQWNWIHLDQPAVFATFNEALVSRYASAVWDSARRASSDGVKRGDAWFDPVDLTPANLETDLLGIAWWWRNPEHDPRVNIRLDIPPALEDRLREVSGTVDRFWKQVEPTVDSAMAQEDGGAAVFRYREISGRAAYRYQDEIWRIPSDEERRSETGSVAPTSVGNDELTGSVDFNCQGAGPVARPVVTGSVMRVHWTGAVPSYQKDNNGGFLCMQRPGRSSLTVRSTVPSGALALEIRLLHLRAVREPLRDGGVVAFRLHLDGLPLEFTGIAPNGSMKDHLEPSEGGRFDELTTVPVPMHVFHGRRHVDVVLEYLYGNTTYRVLQVELRWARSRLETGK